MMCNGSPHPRLSFGNFIENSFDLVPGGVSDSRTGERSE